VLNQLNVGVKEDQSCYFVHPKDNNYNVYVFPDGLHLLKLLRNHFVDSGFESNGKIITKKVIEDIILLSVDNEGTPFFKIISKLKLSVNF